MEDEAKSFMDIHNSLTEPYYLHVLDRTRPYDGQPHTLTGERGKTEVRGITFRDLRDCFIRGCYDASGLLPEDYPKTVYDLSCDDMYPIAVVQNMSCWIEKYMGIYPNVPELHWAEETQE